MTPGDQISPDGDVAEQVLAAVSNTLVRRGWFTTEWWTTLLGGALSTVLALLHVSSSAATHVVAVAAPAILAALYAVSRSMHKSALASALGDLFPQATGAGGAAVAGPPGGPAAVAPPGGAAGPGGGEAAGSGTPTGAAAQTDPDFAFEGIPPIDDGSEGV